MAKQETHHTARWEVAQAMRLNLTRLDLSGKRLKSLPESLVRLTHLRELNLSRNRLQSLPKWLGQLTQLQRLDIGSNELESLPEWLSQLAQLRELNIDNNILKSLPKSLGRLTELRFLSLHANELESMPEWLGQLTKLQRLTLGNNKLKSLPEWLGQLTELRGLFIPMVQLSSLPESLVRLTHLRELSLSNTKLETLPEWLGQLTQLWNFHLQSNKLKTLPEWLGQLTQLRLLNLGNNELQSLPEWLGQLTKLRWLSLEANKLKSLPESLGQLTQLRLLNLDNNELQSLPESIGRLTYLRDLSLRGNKLMLLPESLLFCERLATLFLHGNEALKIPPEILGPDLSMAERYDGDKRPAESRAIIEWYFQLLEEPTRRLNEAKMLIIGQGGVGKTSLVHRLICNKLCDPCELPTEGINIDDWDIQGKKDTDGKFERIDLHIWDFGGQEIMHATHQFFLTQRSLYLLVIDARAGEKESNIHYWLKIVQSYGGDSPVLVVVNKCDQHPHELNETRLMHDYPNIRGFIQTSCVTGQGIAELRREIGKHVRRLPHVFDKLSESYFRVKAELEQTAREQSYIPIESYREICKRHRVYNTKSQDRLIRFLHDLGVVLNFQDPEDPYGQNDPFVLNPEWVTGGVYAIVNDSELKAKRDGLLTCQKLTAVLNALPGYPKNRHDFIVRKMMQFELAYQIEHGRETRWLIPELLDPKEPRVLDWKPEESLNFQYAYPVLPAGVICRFIVRIHQHVDRKRSWRSGTVLKIAGNTVLVRSDTEKNKAFIAVQGAVRQRKESLAIVRDAFRYVHSTIPALGPEEEVPLPDKPDVAVPYDHLLRLEELGERTWLPIGADRLYSVAELLNGVDSNRYQEKRQKKIRKERKDMGEKHVFVSYCRDNRDDVARLVEDLENAGELVWWDEHILGGRDWKEAISEAMKKAFAVVVCFSSELTEERYRSGVYPELRDAIATFRQYGPGQSYIFPVRLSECKVPPIEIDDTRTIERIQHIDLFPENKRNEALRKLLESLGAAPEHP